MLLLLIFVYYEIYKSLSDGDIATDCARKGQQPVLSIACSGQGGLLVSITSVPAPSQPVPPTLAAV